MLLFHFRMTFKIQSFDIYFNSLADPMRIIQGNKMCPQGQILFCRNQNHSKKMKHKIIKDFEIQKDLLNADQ